MFAMISTAGWCATCFEQQIIPVSVRRRLSTALAKLLKTKKLLNVGEPHYGHACYLNLNTISQLDQVKNIL